MATNLLASLLDDGARFAPEYAGGLSDHRPMTLVALRALGADDTRLTAWAAGYDTRLAPTPAPEDWPAGDPWAARLGEVDAWPAYRSLFAQWLQGEPPDDLLPQVLPVLLPGVGAGAFHGLLRTAYAVAADHDGELTAGLAYWAARWLPLDRRVHAVGQPSPPPRRRAGDPPATDDPIEALTRVVAAADGAALSGDLIFDRMAQAAAQPAVQAAVRAWAVTEADAPALARLCAATYARSGNFTVLHGLTSLHAMQVLARWLPDARTAAREHARALAMAWVASGVGPPQPGEPAPHAAATREALAAAAVRCDDEHAIKLVCSALDLHRRDPAPVFLAAAQRALTEAGAWR